jgi:glutamate/tyrosine decarboxylase-like PLP-dependent enzyme
VDALRAGLERAVETVLEYRDGLPESPVTPVASREDVRRSLGDLRDGPTPLDEVVSELVAAATPGLMASAGPRYYGFVVGGSLDAALVADVLTTGWDQNAYNVALSPAAMAFEDVAGAWLKELLGLPASASVGFTTGAQGANTVGLAAGRWHVLQRAGWDVGRNGLQGAPRVNVVVGKERHGTIDRAVRLLGLGERALVEVPASADGSMNTHALVQALAVRRGEPTIVCAQLGNVNTGACDEMTAIAEVARRVGAWLHVDGAFGLWAAASPRTSHLVSGVELADSWACDGHKWLNVPYDAGYAFCAHPDTHATALSYTASYLTGQHEGREYGGGDLVLESSRRARGFATWAALRSLGRSGVAELVDRCCLRARALGERLSHLPGCEILNEIVLNQVLFRFGDDETTAAVLAAVQESGEAWMGGTTWDGRAAIRISVSNWQTSGEDVARTIAAFETALGATARSPAGYSSDG